MKQIFQAIFKPNIKRAAVLVIILSIFHSDIYGVWHSAYTISPIIPILAFASFFNIYLIIRLIVLLCVKDNRAELLQSIQGLPKLLTDRKFLTKIVLVLLTIYLLLGIYGKIHTGLNILEDTHGWHFNEIGSR